MISDEVYFATVIDTARRMTGRTPIVLRNPFTAEIFWVEGMHNCPRDVLAEAFERGEVTDTKGAVRALLH